MRTLRLTLLAAMCGLIVGCGGTPDVRLGPSAGVGFNWKNGETYYSEDAQALIVSVWPRNQEIDVELIKATYYPGTGGPLRNGTEIYMDYDGSTTTGEVDFAVDDFNGCDVRRGVPYRISFVLHAENDDRKADKTFVYYSDTGKTVPQ